MGMVRYSTMTGAEDAYRDVLTSAATSGLISNAPFARSQTFWTFQVNTGAFTRAAYDPYTDAALITNGTERNPSFFYPAWVYNQLSGVSVTGFNRNPTTTVVYYASTMYPASASEVVAIGAAQHYMPRQGGHLGLTLDPNTGSIYQHFWQFAVRSPRGGGESLPYNYGGVSMFTTSGFVFGAGFWVEERWDGVINGGEQTVASAMLTTVAPGRIWYAPAAVHPPLPAVFLDDVVIFVYADLNGTGWISCRARPATASNAWRGTRSMPFGWPMGLAPMGKDRVIVVWWQRPINQSPLAYTILRYDRDLERLVLEDVAPLDSEYTYTWPIHAGHLLYDSRRGRLVLLSPNPNSLHAFTLDLFCHPGIPRETTAPIPLSPAHAGYQQLYALATWTGVTTVGAPGIVVSYPGFTSADLTRVALQTTTLIETGAGTFAVSWSSGASGLSGAVVIGFSTYSVALSATYSNGSLYGTTGMALLTSTATFTVSSTLSAATATSAVANVTILPRIPVSQTDMVGAGSPRLLSYPTSALASPYYYPTGLNPHTWTNIGANVLTPPLYAATRTLTRTVLAQFAGNVTDLEVKETWFGGGDRVAMPLSMFAALWDMYANVPDFASAGYVTWEPRDISSRKFQVLITSLTVGGQDGVTLNHLYKAGGWISETVEMTLRILAEV